MTVRKLAHTHTSSTYYHTRAHAHNLSEKCADTHTHPAIGIRTLAAGPQQEGCVFINISGQIVLHSFGFENTLTVMSN